MKNLSLLVLCMLLTGCSIESESIYTTPKVIYPMHWKKNSSAELKFSLNDFQDPLLSKFLSEIIKNNNNLAISMLRVQRAQLEVDKDKIISEPRVNATFNSGANSILTNASNWTINNSSNFNASYELDLWHKLSQQHDIAKLARDITKDELRLVRLTLLTTASNNYWKLAFINHQIKLIHQNIDYAKETVRLAKIRYQSGGSSAVEVLNAEQNLLMQENFITAKNNERLIAENEQALLLGIQPGMAPYQLMSLPKLQLPKVNSGIPVSALRHRPDVHAKELQLRSALGNIDIKNKQYYPDFSLTTALGSSSKKLLEFIRNPISSSVTAVFSLPFLELRKMKVDSKIAYNDYEQIVLDFKQTLYNAMVSIEDALSLRMQLIGQEKSLQDSLAHARKIEYLNKVRYKQGSLPISSWLDSQEQCRQIEFSLALNRFEQYKNLAKIYFELGGDDSVL
ncbi:TolC family protein [Enterobacter asburiae]|uniref:TolC family protein n=4 Tax=Enterobacter asburiae TaxID=61645 RepID=UPI00192C4487|nr:TolC family protein [Enterobacter asburiae]MBL5912419.1 TolC family protein [Enterobacter asburiae]MBL5916928.1 TolC family protein [Enterobacter asburiae]